MVRSLFHWKVWLNIIIVASLFTGLVYLTFRWLEYHTHHGQEVPVPNVLNKSIHEAIKILDDAGLTYEVDSGQFNPKYRPFEVLDIFPNPGARVKNGRSILLKVNPRTWAKVTIPNIIDTYKGLAFRRLDQVGLVVGDTIYENNVQRDAVIRMMYKGNTIKPGAQLPRFSSIDLVIGTGPKRNIPVPNVVGYTVAEAKKMIEASLFEIGVIEFEDGKQDESDIVYYQDPAVGNIRDQGMQIDIWASKKTPAEQMKKISYLNSIYRMKLDTTLPPVQYEEIPSFKEPSFEDASNTKQEISSHKKVETPKTTSKQNVSSPKTSAKKEVKASTPIKNEKPKVKIEVE